MKETDCRLEADLDRLRGEKEVLKQHSRDLVERIKELDCLYGMSRILDAPGRSLDQILGDTAELLPPAWQYPEIAWAVIRLDGREYTAGNFQKTEFRQSAPVFVFKVRAGEVTVGYTEKRPDADEGPFLKEERSLIDAVAERVGKTAERFRAIARLRESESRYRSLFENSHAVMLLLDPAAGEIVDANPAACAFYGYDRTEMTSRNIADINMLSKSEVLQEMRRARRRERKHFHFRHRLADESIRDVEVHSGPISVDGRSLLFSIVHDITERKRMEQAHRESRELLEKTFVSLEDAVFILDSRDPPEIIDCNPAAHRLFGYSRQEMLGRQTDFLHEDGEQSRQFHFCLLQSIKSKGFFRIGDFFMRRKDGSVFPSENTVAPLMDDRLGRIGWVSVVRDQTDLKQARQELEESEFLYRTLLESSKDGMVLVRDQTILFVNSAFSQMFGYSDPGEFIGMDLLHLFPGESESMGKEMLNPEAKTGGGKRHRGLCFNKKGEKFWVSNENIHIHWKSRPAVLGTFRDITEDVHREIVMRKEAEQLRRENIRLKTSIRERYRFRDLIGKSPPMQRIYEQIVKAAGTDANVLITGESGTGKDLVARAVHDMSHRSEHYFVPVNCAAIPDTLFESEFFGHSKGAFTGAHFEKHGFFRTADGGTLFLDEIGEITRRMQIKLLRAVETGEYIPVGESVPRASDVRLVTATNQDLARKVQEGEFREDFYYRLAVIPIVLPPLRERKEDIPLLIDHFVALFGGENSKNIQIPGEMTAAMYQYHWPGNVRELQSMIQRYITLGDFELVGAGAAPVDIPELPVGTSLTLSEATARYERRIIEKTLKITQGHRAKAARVLGIDPKTLYRKMNP